MNNENLEYLRSAKRFIQEIHSLASNYNYQEVSGDEAKRILLDIASKADNAERKIRRIILLYLKYFDKVSLWEIKAYT